MRVYCFNEEIFRSGRGFEVEEFFFEGGPFYLERQFE